ASSHAMFAVIHLLATFIADLFKPRRRLEVENLFLRHQLNVALRRAPQRVRLRAGDRALMVWMTRMWPSLTPIPVALPPSVSLPKTRHRRIVAGCTTPVKPDFRPILPA